MLIYLKEFQATINFESNLYISIFQYDFYKQLIIARFLYFYGCWSWVSMFLLLKLAKIEILLVQYYPHQIIFITFLLTCLSAWPKSFILGVPVVWSLVYWYTHHCGYETSEKVLKDFGTTHFYSIHISLKCICFKHS